MIRVGFTIASTGEAWLGGLNYYRNLIQALCATPECGLEPVIFTGFRDDPKLFADFPPIQIVRTRLLDRKDPGWVFRKTVQKVSGTDYVFERVLRKHRIAVLSHSSVLGRQAGVPVLGWIPDFQHRHLPQFFDKKEVQRRERLFEATSRDSAAVLLSSQDAAGDFSVFYPQYRSKARVLRFVVEPPLATERMSLTELEAKYAFRGAYIFLPNQFWEHKNHGVVIDALALLKNSSAPVQVLCTGNVKDTRRPEYFEGLKAKINANGLEQNFKILGVIPYSDLVALFRYSRAVINPSLFEGWSTTVEEAKSLGKPVLLSNIAVHQEQNPSGGVYFDPRDPRDLAEKIEKIWADFDATSDHALAERAANDLPARRRDFVETFAKIVKEVVQK